MVSQSKDFQSSCTERDRKKPIFATCLTTQGNNALVLLIFQISEVPEDHKTESLRDREEDLLGEMVKLVNEKNELVHHLDTQVRDKANGYGSKL
jgi:hypothetical protein